MFRRFLLGIAVLSLASVAWANVPDLAQSSAETLSPGAAVYSTPAGTGRAMTNARAFPGTPVDATITLTLVDSELNPIPFYPFDDIWLESDDGGLVYCARGTSPDASTDIDGQAFWTTTLEAGGFTGDGSVCLVMIAGSPLSDQLDLRFNSADINGDLTVNLQDVAAFTPLLTGTPDFRGDFNFDGDVNLQDVAIFTPALLSSASCPGE